MKLSLNTWHRIILSQIFGAVTGDAATIRKAGKILDAIEMSDAEKLEVGLTPVGNQVTWTKPEHTWDIEISDRNAADYFRSTVTAYSGWTASDRKNVEALLAQLDAPKDTA